MLLNWSNKSKILLHLRDYFNLDMFFIFAYSANERDLICAIILTTFVANAVFYTGTILKKMTRQSRSNHFQQLSQWRSVRFSKQSRCSTENRRIHWKSGEWLLSGTQWPPFSERANKSNLQHGDEKSKRVRGNRESFYKPVFLCFSVYASMSLIAHPGS